MRLLTWRVVRQSRRTGSGFK